jgi:anti-sigma regulatory factor (Ser/Thr protein kinase)
MFGERRVWNAKRVKTVELSVDDVTGLATMRHALAVWLESAGVGAEPRADVVLAIHEAVANALEHAHGPPPVLVRAMRVDDGVVVDVLDSGCWKPPQLPVPEDRGRGLGLIRDLVNTAEIITREDGTTVRLCRAA